MGLGATREGCARRNPESNGVIILRRNTCPTVCPHVTGKHEDTFLTFAPNVSHHRHQDQFRSFRHTYSFLLLDPNLYDSCASPLHVNHLVIKVANFHTITHTGQVSGVSPRNRDFSRSQRHEQRKKRSCVSIPHSHGGHLTDTYPSIHPPLYPHMTCR